MMLSDRVLRCVRGTAVMACITAATIATVACGNRDGDMEFKLPRTEEEILAAARRGDSAVAMIAVGQAIADTLARVASGELDRSTLAALAAKAAEPQPMEPPARTLPASGEGMTERAQARGDSLARSEARRWSAEQAATASARRGDSLRGTVVVAPEVAGARRLTLNAPSSRLPVALSGMPTAELGRLDGLEVVAFGIRVSPGDLVVSRFFVRAINGVPVDDGTLVNTGARWSLDLTEGGRASLDRVPDALRGHVGARVWIARSTDVSPSSGVIRPLR